MTERHRVCVPLACLVLLALLTACGVPPAPEQEVPATVEHPVAESQITRVRISPEAVRRLGIETVQVEERSVPSVRRVGGEVMVPPGRVVVLTAPVAGVVNATPQLLPGSHVAAGEVLFRLTPLAPVDRDTRARAVREVAAARAGLAAADARLTRTEALAAERAGSVRAVEEATAQRAVARADLTVAQSRAAQTQSNPLLSDATMIIRAHESGVIRSLSVASGQAVSSGTPLVEIVAVDALWVRVPVYSGDLGRLAPGASASVRGLAAGAATGGRTVRALHGPPTSVPLTGTVDRYYALDSASDDFAPGERVLVSLPLRSEVSSRVIPASALLYESDGSAWVYLLEGEGMFRRARVDVARVHAGFAILAHGPESGARVVSVGAAEVFGTEFAPGH